MDRTKTVIDAFDLAAPEVEPVVARLDPVNDGYHGFDITKGTHEAKLGRSKDLPPDNRWDIPRISSVHCVVRLNDATNVVTLVDQSTNGTWVNGKRIVKGSSGMVLQAGDVVNMLNPTIKPSDDTAAKPAHDVGTTSPAKASEALLEFVFNQIKPTISEAVAKKEGISDGETKRAVDAKLLEELTCSVCHTYYFRAVKTIPCLHSFCDPCVSAFVASESAKDSAPSCPECRGGIYELRPDFKLRNMLDDVFSADPSLRPTDEAVTTFTEKCTVPPGGRVLDDAKKKELAGKMLRKRSRTDDDDDDDDDDDFSADVEEEEEYSDDGGGGGGGGFGFGAAVGALPHGVGLGAHVAHFGTAHGLHPMAGFGKPAPATCPQCFAPAEDGFKCHEGTSHAHCKLCRAVFPIRLEKSQKCVICMQYFCGLYLNECKHAAGKNYFLLLKDHELDELPAGSLFAGNTIEQGILAELVKERKITAGELWKLCRDKFEAKEYGLESVKCFSATGLQMTSEVCRPCCMRVFADLLYAYRRAIPRAELPPAVANRPDCWYGTSCRTQHKNIAHAQNYNHVCPQAKKKE